jgi:hypothetical protein
MASNSARSTSRGLVLGCGRLGRGLIGEPETRVGVGVRRAVSARYAGAYDLGTVWGWPLGKGIEAGAAGAERKSLRAGLAR